MSSSFSEMNAQKEVSESFIGRKSDYDSYEPEETKVEEPREVEQL